jgi:8-oxo-dGTP pyrophosphatase MutT (NUDIX family)
MPRSRPDAVVAVLPRDGRYLVIRRGPQVPRSGYWTPLSGRVEPGESQPEALVREVREEVGLTVRPLARVWQCDTDDGAYRLHWWTAEVEPGEPVLDRDEVSDARWVLPEEFSGLEPTFADDRVFFTRVLPTLAR